MKTFGGGWKNIISPCILNYYWCRTIIISSTAELSLLPYSILSNWCSECEILLKQRFTIDRHNFKNLGIHTYKQVTILCWTKQSTSFSIWLLIVLPSSYVELLMSLNHSLHLKTVKTLDYSLPIQNPFSDKVLSLW